MTSRCHHRNSISTWACGGAVLSLLVASHASAGESSCAYLAGETAGAVLNAQAYCRAVVHGCLVKLTYEGDPGGSARIVRPYAVGVSKKNNMLLFGEQLGDDPESKPYTEKDRRRWRNFNFLKILRFRIAADTSQAHLPGTHEMTAMRFFSCKHPIMVDQ